MDLIPHDELKPAQNFNFAPMIDFLFLMLSLFATLSISRTALYDSDIQLAQLKKGPLDHEIQSEQTSQIHLTITETGSYQWVTEFQKHSMESVEAVQKELSYEYEIGAISHDKEKTKILLHIDKAAPWDPIAKLIFGIRELGFSVHPVYESEDHCR